MWWFWEFIDGPTVARAGMQPEKHEGEPPARYRNRGITDVRCVGLAREKLPEAFVGDGHEVE